MHRNSCRIRCGWRLLTGSHNMVSSRCSAGVDARTGYGSSRGTFLHAPRYRGLHCACYRRRKDLFHVGHGARVSRRDPYGNGFRRAASHATHATCVATKKTRCSDEREHTQYTLSDYNTMPPYSNNRVKPTCSLRRRFPIHASLHHGVTRPLYFVLDTWEHCVDSYCIISREIAAAT